MVGLKPVLFRINVIKNQNIEKNMKTPSKETREIIAGSILMCIYACFFYFTMYLASI